MTERTYSTGEKPKNPIIYRDAVLIIDDIREEPKDTEYPEVNRWSFVITNHYTPAEYIGIQQKRIMELEEGELDNAELIIEILERLGEVEANTL